jgi:hypothetical protein
MKSIRIVLVVLAMLAFSTVATSSAFASLEWNVKKGGTWGKVKATTSVKGPISWELVDTGLKYQGGANCSWEGVGRLQPSGILEITSLKSGSCEPVKDCERLTGEIKPLNLPWTLELYKEGVEPRLRIGSATKGATPEWSFTCRWHIMLSEELLECGMNSTLELGDLATSVVTAFDGKSPRTSCTHSGAGTGELKGVFGTIEPAETGVEAIKVIE